MESEMEAGSMRMVSRGPSNYHRVLTYDIYSNYIYTYIYIYEYHSCIEGVEGNSVGNSLAFYDAHCRLCVTHEIVGVTRKPWGRSGAQSATGFRI